MRAHNALERLRGPRTGLRPATVNLSEPHARCAPRRQVGSRGTLFFSERSVRVALVRMHTFEVGEHYLAVEDMPMLTASVFDQSVRDNFLVFPSELSSATRTLLSEVHSEKV